MGKLKAILYALTILGMLSSCYKEIIIFDPEPDAELRLPSLIRLNGKEVFFDSELDMIRFPVSLDSSGHFSAFTTFDELSDVWFENERLYNNQVNHFGPIEPGRSYSLRIEYKGEVIESDFVFTSLPVVQIITDTKIWDEPKGLARIVVSGNENDRSQISFAGVEYRGQSSRYLDKKSIGFSLWKNMSADSEFSESLLDLKSNSDWILNGAAVDPAGIRNLVSMEVWRNLEENPQGNNSSHMGVNLRLCELYVNNRCQGFYILSEQINHEFLSSAPGDVLYKAIDWAAGATRFETYNPKPSPNRYWNGWEQVVPGSDEILCWEPLNELYEVVTAADDEVFIKNIYRLISIDNFIDYYLFLNLTFAGDNTGKNIFLYRKSSDGKFQIIPWDLDGSWGISFDGSPVNFEGVLTNALFSRLFETNTENFTQKVKSRWRDLRKTSFSEYQVNYLFGQHFQLLEESGIINLENRIWGKNMSVYQQEAYIQTWLANRLAWLDNYFSTL